MTTPIFVLSLKASTDRRARISARLSELDLPFSFFDAIPVEQLGQPEWDRLIDRGGVISNAKNPLSETEISCALSHALIYRKIVDESIRHAFVLEDDAILSDDFAAFVSDGHFESSGEDFVSFYYDGARVFRKHKHPIGRGYSLRKLTRPCSYAVAYFLSQRGARFLWDNSIPIREVADWGADITRIGARITSPCLVGHPPEETVASNIENHGPETRRSPPRRLDSSHIRYKLRKPFSELIW